MIMSFLVYSRATARLLLISFINMFVEHRERLTTRGTAVLLSCLHQKAGIQIQRIFSRFYAPAIEEWWKGHKVLPLSVRSSTSGINNLRLSFSSGGIRVLWTHFLFFLTVTTLWANSADDNLAIFLSILAGETRFDISCKLSPLKTINMKCKILFLGKNKKSILVCCLLIIFTWSAMGECIMAL